MRDAKLGKKNHNYGKPRPQYYQSSGYAIVNYPTIKNKHFTSKNLTDEEKLNMALLYFKEHECSSETKC